MDELFYISLYTKKLFEFLKKVFLILETAISLFFIFKNVCFHLFRGYIAAMRP